MMRSVLFSFVLASTFALSGCQHLVDEPYANFSQKRSYLGFGISKLSPLNTAQVIQIAKKEAILRGHKLEWYEEPNVLGPIGKEWSVFFDGRPSCDGCAVSIGGDLHIMVNENDHTTFFSPGR